MSKVQCFKITNGVISAKTYFIVIDFVGERAIGFAGPKPKPSEIISNFELFDAFNFLQMNAVIIDLANNPEKIWEVEV